MTGTYTGFVKAGRGISVPVVIHFIPVGNGEAVTSNWATTVHWKEIKDMLKGAVDAAVSCHNDVAGTQEKLLLRPPIISFKPHTGFGYKLEENAGKFVDVVNCKSFFMDDDEDGVDEDTGLRDLGGKFKKYTSTSVYIKAYALLRSGGPAEDEEKKINKEMGVKIERKFFLIQEPAGSSSKIK